MEKELKPVRIPNDFTSKYLYARLFGFCLVWFVIVWIMILLQFPGYAAIPVMGAWALSFLGLFCYPVCFDRIVFRQGVQLRIFGKVIRQIPVSDFKLLCSVGDDREQYLCLSIWNLEELAQRREAVLRRGFFSRQDLPFLKRNPSWQERFAKEYLLNPRHFPRKHPILWLPFDPVVVIYLRRLYPHLPYVDLRNPLIGHTMMQPLNQIPFSGEYYRMDEEGIHILGEIKKTERRCFRAERIKTIFRVDRFVPISKTEPVYGVYLVASELSLQTLAERGKRKYRQQWKHDIIDQLPEAEEMYAAEFYFSSMFTWDWKTATECPIKYTPEAETQLRQLYPHAQWVDYSKEWQ